MVPDVDGYSLPARIVRSTPDGFAIAFDGDPATERLAFALVYSGRFSNDVGRISPGAVFNRVLARVLS